MKTYNTNGCRDVTAESMRDAAAIFANRLARKRYGRWAYARTCVQQAHSQDGTLGEYSAFVGTAGRERGTTVGSNINFTVRAL